MAKMTIIGMQGWMMANDDDIFMNLHLPDSVNRQIVIDNILWRASEFPMIWGNPYYVQEFIGTWSAKNLVSWERSAAALAAAYNPIHNYDRMETEEYTGSGTDSATSSSSVTGSGSTTDGSTSTRSVAGFDQPDTLHTADQDVMSGSGTSSSSSTSSGTSSGTRSDSHDIERHLYGNIGVTTSQQMIEAELALRMRNITDIITDSFIREFCILVY